MIVLAELQLWAAEATLVPCATEPPLTLMADHDSAWKVASLVQASCGICVNVMVKVPGSLPAPRVMSPPHGVTTDVPRWNRLGTTPAFTASALSKPE